MSDPITVIFDPAGPPPPRPAPPADSLAKAELEAAMLARPADAALRTAYVDLLGRLTSQHTGLLHVLLPELAAPLYIRAGTPDLAALTQALTEDSFAPELRATPRRILLIGAHAGYAAVALARQHPRAEVLALEPLADNVRLALLNTLAWRRIRVGQAAVWHGATRVAPQWRLLGDWTVRLTDEAMDEDRTIPALSPDEALAQFGWSHADMVVCDAAGAEREIFADPLAPWLRHVDVALVRTHDNLAPNAGAMVAACFPPDTFAAREHAGMQFYERRAPLTVLPPMPPELPLIGAEPGPVRARAANIGPQSLFVFDGGSCQLMPNPPGTPAPRLAVPVVLAGHRRLISGVLHAGHLAAVPPPVVFRARLETPDGQVLASAETTLAARDSGRLVAALEQPYEGPARAVLETEMAPGAEDNRAAWARFIEPKVS